MGYLFRRRKEERLGALAKDGFEASESLQSRNTLRHRVERQPAASAEHEGLTPTGSLAFSQQASEDLKTLERKQKTHREPVQSLGPHSAVPGAPRKNKALPMPPRHPENLVKSGASRSKLRTRHDKRGKHGDQSTRSSSPQISDSSLTHSHRSYRPSLWAWIDHIPQSADDATIIFKVQQVFTLAEQFVNNFYVDRPSQQCQCELLFEHKSFENLPVGIQPSDVIHIVAHPTAMIKHSLVALLLSTILLTRNGPYCLLPSEFTALARAVSSGRGFAADIDHLDAAFASHRVLLSYLCPAMADDSSYLKARDDIIETIITEFERTFSSWLDEQELPEQRLSNFFTLLQETANLGILLFSQPSTFEFNWQVLDPSPSEIDIPIAPRMLKISDENALEIRPNQHMVRIKRVRTQQIARPPQKLNGESPIGGQWNFNQEPPAVGAEVQLDPSRRSPPKKTVSEIRRLTASHVHQRDADQLDHQENEMVHELIGDMNQRFDSPVYEMPASPQANSSPQRGHGEARNSRRHSYDLSAAEAEFYSRQGESTDNTRTPVQARQGQLMTTNTKARSQQPYGPSAYPTGQGSYPLRSGSMDRGRSDSESQRERRRSRSANGAMLARSSTRDNPDSTPRNEGRALDRVPVSGVDLYIKMRSGSARAHEHRVPAAAAPLPAGSFDHAHEARPATHQGIGARQAHNERTEGQQSREQDFRDSLDSRTFLGAGQAQPSAPRHRFPVSMRRSSDSSKQKRKWFEATKARLDGEQRLPKKY